MAAGKSLKSGFRAPRRRKRAESSREATGYMKRPTSSGNVDLNLLFELSNPASPKHLPIWMGAVMRLLIKPQLYATSRLVSRYCQINAVCAHPSMIEVPARQSSSPNAVECRTCRHSSRRNSSNSRFRVRPVFGRRREIRINRKRLINFVLIE